MKVTKVTDQYVHPRSLVSAFIINLIRVSLYKSKN